MDADEIQETIEWARRVRADTSAQTIALLLADAVIQMGEQMLAAFAPQYVVSADAQERLKEKAK